MKEKRLLLLLILTLIGCSRENRTISIDNWNNQIISQLDKTDSLIRKKEEYLEHLNSENIGTKKTKYLLNDFSVTSKITCNGNELKIEVISTRLN